MSASNCIHRLISPPLLPWDILGQQVFFAERDRNRAPEIDDASLVGWDGYTASRLRIAQGWVDANVRTAAVLTGDVHCNWANDVKVDCKDPASPVVGPELVSTSIGSTGNGSGSTTDPTMAWNSHLKFYNDNRGSANWLMS